MSHSGEECYTIIKLLTPSNISQPYPLIDFTQKLLLENVTFNTVLNACCATYRNNQLSRFRIKEQMYSIVKKRNPKKNQ